MCVSISLHLKTSPQALLLITFSRFLCSALCLIPLHWHFRFSKYLNALVLPTDCPLDRSLTPHFAAHVPSRPWVSTYPNLQNSGFFHKDCSEICILNNRQFLLIPALKPFSNISSVHYLFSPGLCATGAIAPIAPTYRILSIPWQPQTLAPTSIFSSLKWLRINLESMYSRIPNPRLDVVSHSDLHSKHSEGSSQYWYLRFEPAHRCSSCSCNLLLQKRFTSDTETPNSLFPSDAVVQDKL